jgi:hypothetical protein
MLNSLELLEMKKNLPWILTTYAQYPYPSPPTLFQTDSPVIYP